MYKCYVVLEERRKRLAGAMSGDAQQMLAPARALIGRQKIMLHDQPSVVLAPLLVTKTVLARGDSRSTDHLPQLSEPRMDWIATSALSSNLIWRECRV